MFYLFFPKIIFENIDIEQSKLRRIEEICDRNTNNVKYVEDNCIICLEEFKEEEKNKLLGKKDEKTNEGKKMKNEK